VELFDPRLMGLLSFLAKRQAWLTPKDISRDFRVDGERPTTRTIHRWFQFLREEGSFVYYPYPKANLLGLQDVLVRIHGLRKPDALGILPFAASFNVEVALGAGEPFVSQGYWVPGDVFRAFRDYWGAVVDLGLADTVEILRSRNTHFIYSPFERTITADGTARIQGPLDNAHFEALLRRNLREPFEVRVGERVAKSPLVIPLVVEHIWTHYSSRQVWEAIRETPEERIREFAKGATPHVLGRPGAALRLLQQQWAALVSDFDEVFLQPRVLFDWTAVKNSVWASVTLHTGTLERMIEAAVRASQISIITHLKPGIEFEDRCHILCWLPADQLLALHKVVREYHRGHDPPVVALQDKAATVDLFHPSYCKVDWRLFDAATLTWRFDGDAYVERLKGLPVEDA